jgi:predicted RNase H-like HicB family nuclease
MVHVPELLGCVVTGPTTEETLAATPEAIRAYRRFLRRHGEAIDPEAPFETRVAEHITEGDWIGNGSPYLMFAPDWEPVTEAELEAALARFGWLREELSVWAELPDAALDAAPSGGGRTARRILLHVLGPTGAYLSGPLGGAPGFSRLHGQAERGEIPLTEALHRSVTMVDDLVRTSTPEQRSAVRGEETRNARTLRKSLRRLLEHDWEHLVELSRRS